ncbi:MAG: hypothetical protein AMR96_03360 [Candidatus Adiutrix intracellularis]|nr:MAG: hypothetical protein AMR96_03360 [Candidatus Adiutrix intracellularis]
MIDLIYLKKYYITAGASRDNFIGQNDKTIKLFYLITLGYARNLVDIERFSALATRNLGLTLTTNQEVTALNVFSTCTFLQTTVETVQTLKPRP